MENTPGCKNGGWTLAMKINGNKVSLAAIYDAETNS